MAHSTEFPPELRTTCKVLDEKKAEDLRILDVSGSSSITNYLVLATGTSEPHLRALRSELEKTLKEGQVRIVGREGDLGTGWTVFDGFDFMVHIFTRDTRSHYQLETLHRDGREIPLASLLSLSPMPAKTTKKPAAKKPATKVAAKKAAPKAAAKKAAPKKAAPKAAAPKAAPAPKKAK
jgi:ribosome-associated protein